MTRTAHGLKPADNGWFVLNAKDSIWFSNGVFGFGTRFEDRENPFGHLGINIRVINPGQPNCHYHGESTQEDFLVLSGRCRLLVNGEEMFLKPWDLVHLAPWTDHVLVGAGTGPCVIVMVGARLKDEKIRYPRSPLALKYHAGVEKSTNDPRISYAKVPKSKPVPAPSPFGRAKTNRRR